MSDSRLEWKADRKSAIAIFSVPYVGVIKLEVCSAFPGNCLERTNGESHDLAIRNARLLVRILAKELDQNPRYSEGDCSSMEQI